MVQGPEMCVGGISGAWWPVKSGSFMITYRNCTASTLNFFDQMKTFSINTQCWLAHNLNATVDSFHEFLRLPQGVHRGIEKSF